MPSSLQVLTRHDSSLIQKRFAREVDEGLSSKPKHISSAHLYNSEGSRIFQDIMDMPEYYLSDCETEILETYKHDIANYLEKETFTLVELGAGNARKTQILLKYFQKIGLDFEYTPIDISYGAMEELLINMRKGFPNLPTKGMVCEYQEGLEKLTNNKKLNFVIFLGSSIGNFNAENASIFCKKIYSLLSPGDYFFLGFDKVKNPKILMQAYDDPYGITKRFNINLLSRINEELGSDFDQNLFKHHAIYDPIQQTMKSYLISQEKQSYFIHELDKEFHFEAWEAIHIEYSWKYSINDVQALAEETGFHHITTFSDERNYFMNTLWRVD